MPNTLNQEDYSSYPHLPCMQESQNNMQYYQYPRSMYNMQSSSMLDMMNSPYRNQNIYTTAVYSQQFETSNCFQEQEKPMKTYDKIDNTEIISKEFSQSSCNNDWPSNTSFNYPSCAQMAFNESYYRDKTKYCSIQKPANDHKNNYADFLYGSSIQHDAKLQENHVNDVCANYYNYAAFSNNLPYESNTQIEQEDSGSDIIVEESEGEGTDYSEDLERPHDYIACLLCKVMYVHSIQFHTVTSAAPCMITSGKPVFSKINEIVKNLLDKQYYLCGNCLGLVNTIDQLQCKLELCRNELFDKFAVNTGADMIKPKKTRSQCKHSFHCKICRKLFSLKQVYKLHIRNHKIKKNFLCELCGRSFSKQSRFKLHYKSHKVPTAAPAKKILAFCCHICKKPFRTKTHLKEHANYCSGTLPYKCKHSNCSKKFATSTKLKNHVTLKHEKKFTSICSICNIGFIKLSDYKSHMITHSTDKKFACTLCDKSYKTLSNLNFHMKFHDKKLPFMCKICNKGFMRKEYLESHVNLHKGIKNFTCQVCEKKFVAQKNLDAHMKHHDENCIKKACSICGKMMASGLEDHIRTHNNLKEFQCSKCELKFNTKGALLKHKKRKHVDLNEQKISTVASTDLNML